MSITAIIIIVAILLTPWLVIGGYIFFAAVMSNFLDNKRPRR